MTDNSVVNPDMLELAPLVVRVLEVGCRDGAFAAAYRSRNPQCHYVGIAADASVAEIVQPHMDHVLIGDIETMDTAALSDGGPFDLILIDVATERMADAEAVLTRIGRLLAPNGYLAIRFPNAAHWRALAHLLHGRAPPENAGPAYTLTSLATVLRQAGLQIVRNRAVNDGSDKAAAEIWLPALGELAGRMKIDRRSVLERSATSHYVVIAKAAAAAPIRRMQIVSAALAPRTMDVRTRLPAHYLRTVPELSVRYQENGVTLPQVPDGMAKIFILQRPGPTDAEDWKVYVGEALRDGWVVIVEYDDHPELFRQVVKRGPEQDLFVSFPRAHAVQTSTEPLAAMFRQYNPEVAAFANTAFTLPPLRPRAPGPARVFFGALNRGAFSGALARALAPAIEAHPETVFDVVNDRTFFEALPTDRKTFRRALGYDAYLDALEANDIGLLALAGEPFELFKSDLKYVESASRGTAVIASPAVYGETIRDGETGLIAPRLEDWAPALCRLLENDSLREGIVRRAWEDVRDHRMFATQIESRVDWYWKLWNDRERLHREMLTRCPELLRWDA
ncbi:MAG: methyltransferase domain-containing protein [Pseudomonadota bacterium]